MCVLHAGVHGPGLSVLHSGPSFLERELADTQALGFTRRLGNRPALIFLVPVMDSLDSFRTLLVGHLSL